MIALGAGALALLAAVLRWAIRPPEVPSTEDLARLYPEVEEPDDDR